MQRITMTLDEPLNRAFDIFLTRHGYTNRSEALRDLIRERLDNEQLVLDQNGMCIAHLTYVYNHHVRELAARLTQAQHDHHELSIAALHVHLDHDNCLETLILRGAIQQVQSFAKTIMTQSGVRHGRLYLLPVVADHADDEHAIQHLHLVPHS